MKSLLITLIVSVLATAAVAGDAQSGGGSSTRTDLHAANPQYAKLHKSKTHKHSVKRSHKAAHRKLKNA